MKLFPISDVLNTLMLNRNQMYRYLIIILVLLLWGGCSTVPSIKKTSLRVALQNRCDQGDSQACVDLAKAILSDKTGDTQRAVSLLTLSCETKHPEGCFLFAQMLERGIGVSQSLDMAKVHYRFACENKITAACNNLAILLKVTGENLTEVNNLQQHGCEQGDGIACFNIGFKAEQRTPKDWELARTSYEKACGYGFAEGCSYLGVIYRHGRGIQSDLKRGAELYRKACMGGYMIGCNSMGYLYQIGSGVEKDPILAHEYYSKACKGGLTRACTNLGTLAEQNSDGKKSKEAVDFYTQSCKSGDGKGCSRLGVLHLGGTHGAKKDEKLALEKFVQSCEKNYGPGCCNVGVIEEDGIGKKPDYDKAKAFYERACKLEEYKGCHNLGVMHAEGVGGEKSMGTAADYFMVACENGFSNSCSYLGDKWLKLKTKKAMGIVLLKKGCEDGDEWGCDVLQKNGLKK